MNFADTTQQALFDDDINVYQKCLVNQPPVI